MSERLAYGDGFLSFSFPKGIVPTVLEPRRVAPAAKAEELACKAVRAPLGTLPLAEMLRRKQPESVVVVVNDCTRPTPYATLFPPLLEAFAEAGVADSQVTILVATGIHEPHTEAINRQLYGDAIVDRFTVVSHDADAAPSLSDLGMLESGYRLHVNSLACDADFLITLGIVTPHYFAGYSGGRKSILPGICGRETVESNHARMVEIMDHLPAIDDNPISLEMIAAARRVGVDFILNAVMNENQEVVDIVGGDLVEAWREAVTVSARIYESPLQDLADVCVVSAGGWPRDINAYQAQKALDHADKAVRPGGAIILAAECSGIFGDETFRRWLLRGWPPEKVMAEIKRKFAMGGHKAYGYAKVASAKRIFLISSLDDEDTKRLYAVKFASIQEAVDKASALYGAFARWLFMPYGGVLSPVLSEK